jgi:formate transporter
MTDKSTIPEPDKLHDIVFSSLADKATLPMGSMLILGALAGIYIGLGGMFATVALTGAEGMPYGVGQAAAGLLFAVGLALVIIAGAELFTGNTMMAGAVIGGRIAPFQAIRALAIVYGANFCGSLLLAFLVLGAGVHEANDGAFGRTAVAMGQTKIGKPFMAVLASGILANMLVCLAVWLAYAGHTVTQKLAGLILPIAAFVAAGLEHSVANMYLLPYALMVQFAIMNTGTAITIPAIVSNLVPATVGNIIGGASIALAYWLAYGKPRER